MICHIFQSLVPLNVRKFHLSKRELTNLSGLFFFGAIVQQLLWVDTVILGSTERFVCARFKCPQSDSHQCHLKKLCKLWRTCWPPAGGPRSPNSTYWNFSHCWCPWASALLGSMWMPQRPYCCMHASSFLTRNKTGGSRRKSQGPPALWELDGLSFKQFLAKQLSVVLWWLSGTSKVLLPTCAWQQLSSTTAMRGIRCETSRKPISVWYWTPGLVRNSGLRLILLIIKILVPISTWTTKFTGDSDHCQLKLDGL